MKKMHLDDSDCRGKKLVSLSYQEFKKIPEEKRCCKCNDEFIKYEILAYEKLELQNLFDCQNYLDLET